MRARLSISLLVVALAVTACGPRQVEVRTAPAASTTQTVNVTNNLSQAVNVYVSAGAANDAFLRQVPANTVESVAVPADLMGKTVVFKAVTVDGSRTYRSRDVVYAGAFVWNVP